VNYLLDACNGGAYTYEMNPGRTGSWRTHEYTKGKPFGDNSNSQYGLLGIWSAAEVGAEVSADYWTTVEKHWTTCQAVNGQWDYYTRPAAPAGIPTMTAAGLASLLVCHDYIDAPSGTVVGREPFTPAIAKGLAWLETGKNSYYVPGYASYALERVGLASGFKYFGANDWYRDGATRLINMQQADGSWNERTTVIGTAFNLLFLARGRHALLMSKLRFDHYWCNRPRDLANLCKFTGHELENVFNWQVVSTEHDWTDWLDAPVLYIASHEAPKLKDADFANIRSYVEAGGLLFTHQDGDSTAFNSFVEQVLLKKTFPNYEFTKVPQTHDLYSLGEKDFKAKPLLQMVSNGARALWIHSPADLSAAWQMNAQTSKKDAFNVGLNLFMYSAGKKNFLNRVHSNFISAPPAAAAANNIKVARVKYAVPTWDPEPYAWKRFGNWLGWETSLGISTQAVEMADLGGLAPADVPLAHLTGTNQYTITDAQAQSLAKYVEAGGILLIDSCGGTNFNGSIEKLIAKAFPDTHGKKLTPAHPLLSASADGMSDLSKLELRPYAQNRLGKKGGTLYELNVGKGHVIYTHLDLTNGLLGSRTWGIVGFDTTTSLQLLKNILLWSARGAPENQQ